MLSQRTTPNESRIDVKTKVGSALEHWGGLVVLERGLRDREGNGVRVDGDMGGDTRMIGFATSDYGVGRFYHLGVWVD